MSAEDNKALIRRWLRMGEQGFTGDFNEFFTPDYRGHLSGEQPQSLIDLMAVERGFAAAFSNIAYNVEELLAVGDTEWSSGSKLVPPIPVDFTVSRLPLARSRSPGS
ncbi:MAG TPA: hypothetical protein VHW25_06970 [Steroidobacteraceae bacterium]|jgi:hypothetical protein|nr:hypothetical protein [Steroidobacteraceae bacterium]